MKKFDIRPLGTTEAGDSEDAVPIAIGRIPAGSTKSL